MTILVVNHLQGLDICHVVGLKPDKGIIGSELSNCTFPQSGINKGSFLIHSGTKGRSGSVAAGISDRCPPSLSLESHCISLFDAAILYRTAPFICVFYSR